VNVGLVIYGSLATRTGGYRYDRKMAAALERRGHRVRVIRLPALVYPLRLALNWQPPQAVAVAADRLDLLIQDELCHPSLIRPNRLRRRGHPPVVTVVHQVICDEPRVAWQNRILRLAEKRYLDDVDAFIFNSRCTRDTVWRLTGGGRPYVVAPPGGDRSGRPPGSEAIVARALRPGPLRLVFLGNLIPRKGLLPLIAALAMLPRGIWELRVAGRLDMDRAHVRKVRRMLRDRDLQGQVHLLGWREGPALAEELTRAQVFCMPYAYEGFGMATLEAQAYGLPVIGCREGATPELIDDGVNGRLVGFGDLDALANAVSGLYADRPKLIEMSLAAHRRFDHHPTWEASMGRLTAFLEDLAASAKAAAARPKERSCAGSVRP
jgi:glycosyltransferase involved in cell wall biosynthesis